MRPGLVVIGILLLVIAAGTLISIYLVPRSPETQQQQTTVIPTALQPGESLQPIVIQGTSSENGNLAVHWQSTLPLDVALFPPDGCGQSPPVRCPPAALMSWSQQESGNFSFSGATAFPMTIQVQNPSNRSGTFQATAVASHPVTVGLVPLASLFVDAAAGALIVLGVVSAFLGFFLRGNVLRSAPPPPVSRSAEDVSDLVGDPPAPDPLDRG